MILMNYFRTILPKRLSLSKQFVRLERVDGGFSLDHGKYRELRKLNFT